MENQLTEDFQKVLEKMPITFTSNDFGKGLRNIELDADIKKIIKLGLVSIFKT
jgi:hypothetical protein